MRRIVHAALVTAAVLTAAVAPPAGAPQEPMPAFRAGVEIVDVDVSVLDKNRHPVTGLTAADFTVLEDGKARPIVAFTPVELAPRELTPAKWMADVAPDVLTNDLQREGRLIAVLIDRAIAFPDLPAARKIAESVIDELRPTDLAAVVYTELGVPQNFTADRRRLLDVIGQPSAGLPEGDRGQIGSCYCGACTLERITNIATALRDVRQRRKLLFVVSSNIAISGRGNCGAMIGEARQRALRAIGSANLTVYVLDPSGLTTLAPPAASSTGSRGPAMANLTRISNLMTLPDETGGRAILGNEPYRKLPELFRESDAYYVLGFRPGHADGRHHDIAIKLTRRDLILQARRGYEAAGAKPKPPAMRPAKGIRSGLYSALADLWPKTDLPLTISATPVAMAGLKAAAVALMLDVGGPRRAAASLAGDHVTPAARALNVLVGAFDRNGRMLVSEQGDVRITLDASGRGSLLTRLDLKPGTYELRAAVEDTATGETGSVYTYVDVPIYVAQLVTMSGVLLTTKPEQTTGLLNNPLRAPFSWLPTIRREFARTEHVTAWLQIYQGLTRPAMPGYVLVEVRNENDERVFHQETRTIVSDVGANRAIPFEVELPLTNLERGQYLLRVDVRQGNATATQQLRFTVK